MTQVQWQKSSFSSGDAANCLEVAAGVTGCLHLRESDEQRLVVTTTTPALAELIRAVKNGRFEECGE